MAETSENSGNAVSVVKINDEEEGVIVFSSDEEFVVIAADHYEHLVKGAHEWNEDEEETPEPSEVTIPSEVTDRGFKHYPEIETSYGHIVRVYESSSAMEPHIWLKSSKGAPRWPGDLAAEETHTHLTIHQAEQVRDALDACIKNHYQNA